MLLSLAKFLGYLVNRWGWPVLVGEILCGILLGPTILGRILPSWHHTLFPADMVQQNMLETISWVGVLFLLLVTGFEVRLSSVWKQGKTAVTVGSVGVIIPIIIGFVVFYWLPASYRGPESNRLIFTLLLSTAAAISAIPVIAKILYDMDILKSDLGLTTLSAFVVNDILGWLIFTLVLGFAGSTSQLYDTTPLRVFFEIILFGTICLTIGSKLVGRMAKAIKESILPQTATILTFITILASLCGIITQWIGVHAILGFFVAGIMAGNTEEISEHTILIWCWCFSLLWLP
ncbi:MAG: cation:proton antiporter [bacterium]